MATTPEWKAAIAQMMAGANPAPLEHREVPGGIMRAIEMTNRQLAGQAAKGIPGIISWLQGVLPHRAQGDQWWIPQPAPVAAIETQLPAVASSPSAWGDIEQEAQKREAITNQLGEFGRRVLASKWLMGE